MPTCRPYRRREIIVAVFTVQDSTGKFNPEVQIGSNCAISSTLYDLKSETTEKAASVRTECSENALMDGMDQISSR